MAESAVITAIVMLSILAVIELVYIFAAPTGSYNEKDAFTVLVYRTDDADFARFLRSFISQRRWMECGIFEKIYVVYTGSPENISDEVREICCRRKDIVFMGADEFSAILNGDKNS
ncbi:MAG: hypothetical protein J6B17_03860 [Ruminococcus sp.]|nr:hypothetical protein [Ruminococcus sp.]